MTNQAKFVPVWTSGTSVDSETPLGDAASSKSVARLRVSILFVWILVGRSDHERVVQSLRELQPIATLLFRVYRCNLLQF